VFWFETLSAGMRYGWMDGMGGWMGGWMDGWIGWMGGWPDVWMDDVAQ